MVGTQSTMLSAPTSPFGSSRRSVTLPSLRFTHSRPSPHPKLKLDHTGAWNDPDMLVGSSPQAAVYNTPDQARSQFSLWSVMAAPLLIGSNILNLSSWDFETYTNREVHARVMVFRSVTGDSCIRLRGCT